MRTHFQNFLTDDGLPVTVEYSVDGSYVAPSYSPMYGADGGDAAEFCIKKVWPNTPGYHALCRQINLTCNLHPYFVVRFVWHWWVRLRIALADWACTLTDDERERMETWLAEHHVEDDYEPADYEF